MGARALRHVSDSAAILSSAEFPEPERKASLDEFVPGEESTICRGTIAALAAERGDPAEVARQWRAVLAECLGDREAVQRLGRLEGRRVAECDTRHP